MTSISGSVPNGASCNTACVSIAHVLAFQSRVERVWQQALQEARSRDVASALSSTASSTPTLSRKYLVQHPVCVSCQQTSRAHDRSSRSTLQQIQSNVDVGQPSARTVDHAKERDTTGGVCSSPNIHKSVEERTEEDDRTERIVGSQDDRTHDEKRPEVISSTATEMVELEIGTVAVEEENIEEEFESTPTVEEGGEYAVNVELVDDELPGEGEAPRTGDGKHAWKGDGARRSKHVARYGGNLAYLVHDPDSYCSYVAFE